jgi:hypothetical protein
MRLHIITIASSILVPTIAFAAGRVLERPIILPDFTKETVAMVPLDTDTLRDGAEKYLVVTDYGIATPFRLEDGQENLMSQAIFDEYPAAADTVPKTTITQMTDSEHGTYFQPQTSGEYVFRFHFQKTITPEYLRLSLSDGFLESITVRIGTTATTLKPASVGSTTSSVITLSGEQAKYFEVTIRIYSGVLRIEDFALTSSSTMLSFRAVPDRHYSLLYGPGLTLHTPDLMYAYTQDPVIGALGTEKTSSQKNDDYDGVDASRDLCPTVWNPDQADTDHDGPGDACDNCPSLPNTNQLDADQNGLGDVCDDEDKDGRMNGIDNCPHVSNPGQQDSDLDGIGNMCDTTDDRWSEQHPWLLWFSMGGLIVILVALGAWVLFKSTHSS